MTAKWQAGHTYVPGSLVIPSAAPAPTNFKATNGYFEDGDTGWDYTGGNVYSATGGYGSDKCCTVPGSTTGGVALNKATFSMPAGTSIKATCMIQQGASDVDHTRGYAQIYFYDSDDTQIGDPVNGNIVNDGSGGAWHASTVTAKAPAGTSYARAGIYLYQNSADAVWGDNLVVESLAPSIPDGLVYKATQADPGKSGSHEPTWPGVTGTEVTDNEVTWEGVIATSITWEASPLALSGDTEPTWPDSEGGVVRDGTINWTAFTPQAKGAPHSKIVTVGANKVFAGDGDIVKFCATNDANDWTKQDDAGYLPTGLFALGETECTALSIYRGNLVPFTSSCMQVWQIDPDPTRMGNIDAVEGVGSDYIRAAVGMMNDLYFTSGLGVRSVGIAATTGTMGATDVGTPADALVRAALAGSVDPVGVFFANASQFWLFCGTKAFVYSVSKLSKVAAWSEYTLPWSVSDACTLDGKLYVRAGDDVYQLDEAQFTDDVADTDGVVTQDNYDVTAQWPWLDLSAAGVEKMIVGVDCVVNQGTGTTTGVSIGYDENDEDAFTASIDIAGDTRPGQIVPIPVAGVSVSPKLTHTSDASWVLTALTVYYHTMRPTS